MVRKTSAEAYRKISESGLLSAARWQVYDVAYQAGPLTANQVAKILEERGNTLATVRKNTHARLTELRDLGVIEEQGTVICPVTGMRVIQWDVTGKLPQEPVKHIDDRVNSLCEKAEKLQAQLDQTLQELRAITDGYCPACMSLELRSFPSGNQTLFACLECKFVHCAEDRKRYKHKVRNEEAA